MLKRTSVLKAMLALFAAGEIFRAVVGKQVENDVSPGSVAFGIALVGAALVLNDIKTATGLALH